MPKTMILIAKPTANGAFVVARTKNGETLRMADGSIVTVPAADENLSRAALKSLARHFKVTLD